MNSVSNNGGVELPTNITDASKANQETKTEGSLKGHRYSNAFKGPSTLEGRLAEVDGGIKLAKAISELHKVKLEIALRKDLEIPLTLTEKEVKAFKRGGIKEIETQMKGSKLSDLKGSILETLKNIKEAVKKIFTKSEKAEIKPQNSDDARAAKILKQSAQRSNLKVFEDMFGEEKFSGDIAALDREIDASPDAHIIKEELGQTAKADKADTQTKAPLTRTQHFTSIANNEKLSKDLEAKFEIEHSGNEFCCMRDMCLALNEKNPKKFLKLASQINEQYIKDGADQGANILQNELKDIKSALSSNNMASIKATFSQALEGEFGNDIVLKFRQLEIDYKSLSNPK